MHPSISGPRHSCHSLWRRTSRFLPLLRDHHTFLVYSGADKTILDLHLSLSLMLGSSNQAECSLWISIAHQVSSRSFFHLNSKFHSHLFSKCKQIHYTDIGHLQILKAHHFPQRNRHLVSQTMSPRFS